MFAQKVSYLSTSEVIFANLESTHFLNLLENSTLSRLTHSDKEPGFLPNLWLQPAYFRKKTPFLDSHASVLSMMVHRIPHYEK